MGSANSDSIVLRSELYVNPTTDNRPPHCHYRASGLFQAKITTKPTTSAHMFEVLALHRYYIWANRLREHFDSTISVRSWSDDPEAVFIEDQGLFLSHWYAALFVVVEGWQQLKLSDQEIDKLLTSPNIDLLRRFRHGVCHYQRNYNDPRFLDLMQAQGLVRWVRQLNMAFGNYFLQKLTPPTEATL